jgi:microcystin-dependent protein
MYEKFLALIVVFLVGVLLSSMLFPSGRKQSEYFVDCTPRGVAPEGTVVAFVGTVAPTGWLMCDGQAYSKTTYASLFAVIGEKFGSTGSTAGANDMFRVPDLRGMFIRGLDAGAIRDVDVSARESLNGGFTGANIGSYQKDAVQEHNHPIGGCYQGNNDSGFTPRGAMPGVADSCFKDGDPTYKGTWAVPTIIKGVNGARSSTETRPKNIAMNYIIRF